MKANFNQISKKLGFRIILPIIFLTILIGAGLYVFVLRSISQFTYSHIKDSINDYSHEIYNICDRNLNELIESRNLNNERTVRIKKGVTLGALESYFIGNNLSAIVFENGRKILSVKDFDIATAQKVESEIKEGDALLIELRKSRLYASRIEFEPWGWHIVFAKDASAYSSLVRKVNLAYALTAIILIISAILLLEYFNMTVNKPIKKIIDSLKKQDMPAYKGIQEFEFLSDNIRQIMDSLKNETRMLNNIYYIAATKRGDIFFDEVVMTISRIFGMNSFIARINPDYKSEHVISMCLNMEIKKGFDIELKGTPCEEVVTRKHLSVFEKDAYYLFPQSELLRSTNAESFIGFAIFDRKGNVIGTVNAFGKQREFSDSDIKVLQTIGQMVAAELERIDEENEKRKMQEQLYQSQKMEAIGKLAGGIAHDFNNMLQAILGYASLIKMQMSPLNPLFRNLEIIEHTAERAAQLTRQLLGFARKGKYVIEVININELLNSVLSIINRTFDRSINIKTNLTQHIPAIEGDRTQIEQVILNLCLNARDAMPGGGTLYIETFATSSPRLSFMSNPPENRIYTAIKISDTGTGMDEHIKKHIFEPFFTTKEIGKGTGMGLAMAYGVIKNHNGFITVESEKGAGSTFTVYLPATEKEISATFKEDEDLLYGKGTVLVVDDEEIVRNVSKDILSSLGYYVLTATNGKEALEFFSTKKEEIDLVILDLSMPVMSGNETFRRMKEIDPEVKVLISTGYDTDNKAKDIAEQGIVGFIQKPFKIDEIAEKINLILQDK